jgi:hypothetical protein
VEVVETIVVCDEAVERGHAVIEAQVDARESEIRIGYKRRDCGVLEWKERREKRMETAEDGLNLGEIVGKMHIEFKTAPKSRRIE